MNGSGKIFWCYSLTIFQLVLQDLVSHSYRALVLHGGVDQIDRDSTILDFKAGRIPILVATSVCARGLDVKQLILVVNFDCPNHYEDYVHRYEWGCVKSVQE